MSTIRRLLHFFGLFTRRDVAAEWVEGYLYGARKAGVVNEGGRFRPARGSK